MRCTYRQYYIYIYIFEGHSKSASSHTERRVILLWPIQIKWCATNLKSGWGLKNFEQPSCIWELRLIVFCSIVVSEIEVIIYELKWYSPTSIISLALLVLRLKLVYYWPRSFRALSLCFCMLQKQGFFYTSALPEVMWYEPLCNSFICWVI